MPDAGPADAGPPDEGVLDPSRIGAPRPLAPLSTSTATSQRPTFRWELGALSAGARLELCEDRACTRIIETIDANGSSGVPTRELPAGTVFWRVFGRAGDLVGDVSSPTWQVTIGHRTAPLDGSWGTTLDVNGDGFSDVAVGSFESGRVYVYLGSPSGLTTSPTTTIEGPDVGMGLRGSFGAAVASAGDINGDGYGDLVVGAPGGNGHVHIFAGGAGGVSVISLSVVEGFGGVFGLVVSSAGDADADGYADVVIGAPNERHAYLYRGGPLGLIDAGSALSTRPYTSFLPFGGSVTEVGDADNDGRSEIAVGMNDTTSLGDRRVYVYRGTTPEPETILEDPDPTMLTRNYGGSLAGAGDVNGDGYADLAIGGRNYMSGDIYLYPGGRAGIRIYAETTLTNATGERLGFSVDGAGDVNGDGYADLVAGTSVPEAGRGSVNIYFGGPTGLDLSPAAMLTPFGGTYYGFDDRSGYRVVGVGDVNGDGYSDIACSLDARAVEGARVFVYHGGPDGLASSPASTLIDPDGSMYFGFSG